MNKPFKFIYIMKKLIIFSLLLFTFVGCKPKINQAREIKKFDSLDHVFHNNYKDFEKYYDSCKKYALKKDTTTYNIYRDSVIVHFNCVIRADSLMKIIEKELKR